MKTCKFCNITVNTDKERCPACKNALDGETPQNFVSEFPSLLPAEKDVLLKRVFNLIFAGIIGFFSIALLIILTGLVPVDNSAWWSFFLGLSVVSAFWITRNAVISNKNPGRRIFFAAMLSLGASIIIDALFFHVWHATPEITTEWSLIFVLPSVASGLILAYTVLMLVNQKSMSDYYVYIFFAIVLNFVPLIVYHTAGIGYNFVAYACVILNIVTIVLFSAINLKSIIEEIKKKLHI